MEDCHVYEKDTPLRLLLVGDESLGIVILYISPAGARTTLIERSAIEEYALKNHLTFDFVYGLLMTALYYIGVASESETFDSGSTTQKSALDARAAAAAELWKLGGNACNADFCFLVKPKDDTAFSITRFSTSVNIIKELIAATDATENGEPCKGQNTAKVFKGSPTG